MKLATKLLFAVSLLAAPLFASDAEIDQQLEKQKEMFKMELRSAKRDVIAMNIPITDSVKAELFWEIYDSYETAIKKENTRYLKLLKEYATNFENMSDKVADKLVKDLYNMKKKRQKIELKTYKQMSKKVSVVEAARFVQINNRMRLLLDLGIASHLPMMLPEGVSVSEDGAVILVPSK